MPASDGRSLWATLQGRPPKDWRDETFSEFCESRGGVLPSRMIRSGKWKLWAFVDAVKLPPALFDLEQDPNELHDLGRDPKFADVRARLLRRLAVGWDPASVRAGTLRAIEDFTTLARWGRAVRPPNPDAMEVPGPDFEAGVQLR